MVDKLFDCLINNKHFYIFKKGSGNEEVEGADIRIIYQQLNTLPSYLINQDHLSEKMNWTGEDEAALREYLEKCETRFSKVVDALQEILGLLSKSSLEECEGIKNKHYSS